MRYHDAMLLPILPGILTIVAFLGMFLAYLYGRSVKRFRWSEYIALLATPVGICLWIAYVHGIKVLYLFAASAIVGFFLEFGLGLAYHKTLNRRLWTYSRYSVGGYTSWLTLPMWGVAGVAFWILSNKIGL